jgi:hypothetical protein
MQASCVESLQCANAFTVLFILYLLFILFLLLRFGSLR